MSIRSDFYPLHDSILPKKNIKKHKNKVDNYRNTHRYHTELLNKLHPEKYIFSPKNNLQMIPGNYLSDRDLCVVSNDGSDLGKASGCSVTHKNMIERPKQDYIKKISDDSFASQIIPSNKNKNINDVPGIDLYNHYKVHDYDTINSPMGGLNEPHGLNSDDLYKEYCYNKYEEHFKLPDSI